MMQVVVAGSLSENYIAVTQYLRKVTELRLLRSILLEHGWSSKSLLGLLGLLLLGLGIVEIVASKEIGMGQSRVEEILVLVRGLGGLIHHRLELLLLLVLIAKSRGRASLEVGSGELLLLLGLLEGLLLRLESLLLSVL